MWQYLLIIIVGFIAGACTGYCLKRRKSSDEIDGILNLYLPNTQEEPPEMYINIHKTIPELKDCDVVTFRVRRITDCKS